MMIRLLAIVALVTAIPCSGIGQDLTVQTDPLSQYRKLAQEKWGKEIEKLEKLDQQPSDSSDAILFLGSSSIRLWKDLAEDMAPRGVINRGYGGAKFSDLAVYIERLVKPHQCTAIVVFVGNDIVGKPDDKTPAEVARLFKYIVDQIRKIHPTQPIFLIAVTPTPARFTAWPEIRRANVALSAVCDADPSLHFVATEMHYLDHEGKPIEKYFGEDKLHQTREGYLVWGRIVKEHLDKVLGAVEPASAK